MKKINTIILCLVLAVVTVNAQNTPAKDFYSKEFDWTITIPENFESVSAEEWAKLQNRGAEAIESTTGEKIESRAKTVFVFRTDQLNCFESNYQPFDVAIDGDHAESCRQVNEVLYQTFVTQMEGITVDTASTYQTIDGLQFYTTEITVAYPTKMVLHVFMFSRLFGKKEFTVNVMYVNKEKGKVMLAAWRKSKFGKKWR